MSIIIPFSLVEMAVRTQESLRGVLIFDMNVK